MALDPVLFEVLRHRLEEIVAEAYYIVARTSGNAVISECGDHLEALLDADGNTVTIAGGVVSWTSILECSGKYIVQNYEENPGIYDGDHFVFNATDISTVHKPDIEVLTPIFWEGKRVAWMVTGGHTLDIGSIDPGGLSARAEEALHEGLRLPGLKLIEKGRRRADIENTIRGMVRMPDLMMLDVGAEIAANNGGTKRLKEMIEKYGIDTILTLFREVQDYSEKLARRKISKLPNGTWHAVDYVESVKPEERLLKVELTVTKKDDQLTFDFTGSSPQSAGSQNSMQHHTVASVLCVYLWMLVYDVPWTGGVWRPLKYIMPEGTIVNASPQAAVAFSCPFGTVDLVTSCTIKVMGEMLLATKEFRKDAVSGTGGVCSAPVLHGIDKAGGFYATPVMDAVAGGMGAQCYRDGEDACTYQYTPRPLAANLESMEEIFPWLCLFRKEATDTGGPGKFRGGVTNVMARIPYETNRVNILSNLCGTESRITLGFAGGYPAPNTQEIVIRNSSVMEEFKSGQMPSTLEEIDGRRETIPAYVPTALSPTDVVVLYQAGGGGYGDPIDRDPKLVARDVKLGYVSVEAAKKVYGVVINPQNFEIDGAGTKKQRQAIANERLRMGTK